MKNQIPLNEWQIALHNLKWKPELRVREKKQKIESNNGMRKCTTCLQEKKADEFEWRKYSRRSQCRVCVNKARRKRK